MGLKSKIEQNTDYTDECLRWYSANLTCENTGHVWLSAKGHYSNYYGSGLIVNATGSDGKQYVSGLYGRLERRCAYMMAKISKRRINPLEPSATDLEGLGQQQIDAIDIALKFPISIITGGPGTGKTTIAKTIANRHRNIVGISPTGKGADRLGESIGQTCYTIHRMYGMIQEEGGWDLRFSKERTDLIMCDEFGMAGIDTYEYLLHIAWTMPNARIVLIGDPGQLPSVSPGCVLDEIIKCLPHVHLNTVYRYDDYHIGMACDMASQGKIYNPGYFTDNYSVIAGANKEYAFELYKEQSKTFGNSETRIITFHTRDAYDGNRKLFYINGDRPIVCTKNNRNEGVYNGQTGIIKGPHLFFGNKKVRADRILWQYAFASTCHKAQGGQWRCIIVHIPSARYISNQWMRTAASRAIEKLYIVIDNSIQSLEAAMKSNTKPHGRISLLSGFVNKSAIWHSGS